MRARPLAWGLALALAAGSAVSAAGPETEPDRAHGAPPGTAAAAPVELRGPREAAHGDALSPRAQLASQIDEQIGSIDRALAAVGDKLAAAQIACSRRLGAALRLTRAGRDEDALMVARRRAAAGLLLARDRGERGLLADEHAQLRAARDRLGGERARLPGLALPGELARPALGKIARHFGALEHERTRATLSRRGIDIDVDDHSPVTAPAAGTVRYAGPIRGLDQGVVIDHGDYLTVVAKLGELALPIGAPIARGDRVGRSAHHRVYLEVRVKLGPGGLPIDPEPLLAPALDPAVRHVAQAGHRDAPAPRTR